jgi:hypothetical protein
MSINSLESSPRTFLNEQSSLKLNLASGKDDETTISLCQRGARQTIAPFLHALF